MKRKKTSKSACVANFSGGKDSTAMLRGLIERGEAIHSVLWFDTEREFPEILDHIALVRKQLVVPFVRIRHWAGFDFLQARYGPAHKSGGWCTAAKRDCCNKYIRLVLKDHPDAVECIGFTTDEHRRAERLKKKWPVRFPLIEWEMSEKDCLAYCIDRGYTFGGIYDWMPSLRVSCYDCPKQSKADWAAIKEHHPELYARAIAACEEE